MKPILPAVALALTLMLGGCADSRTVAFNEADFASTARKGTGVVTGRAYVVTDDGETLYPDNQPVLLSPVTAYTTETIERRYIKGEHLEPADPRLAKYSYSTTTDGHGNFTLRGIPAGDYYVEGIVPWQSSYQVTMNDGTELTYHRGYHKLYFTRITVKDGQTVHVTKFDQRNPTYKSFYAHGGNVG